jgi:mediator of RNA polymerase II transcription subunit 12
MHSNPESFISPKTWLKYRDVLITKFSAEIDNSFSVLVEIDRRNSQLDTSGAEKEVDTPRRIITLLDNTLSQPINHELIRQWWKMDRDKDMLIQTVLEWAVSSHRPGVAKTYLATRILRIWCQLGADATSAILDFIEPTVSEVGRDNNALYHLVSELARSQHFSTPRYLQWLIARGGLHDAADVLTDAHCCTRLLAELPTHNLSDGILELRMTLLTRADFSVDEEEEQIRGLMAAINVNLPDLQTSVDHDLACTNGSSPPKSVTSFSGASRTCKSELGLWLRQKIRIQMIQPTIPPLDDWDTPPMKRGTSAITVSEFYTIRGYLELVDDYTMLADVMKIVASSNDIEVLASCADTLNLHQETFSAIGALNGLFDNLMSRLRGLSDDIDSVPRSFLLSLSELAAMLPEQEIIAQQLAQELFRSDRKNAADACSPVSDHMAVVETAEADFTDEIEKVLASGTSMDQGTLDRLFHRIIQRLEASWQKLPEQQRSCGLLLTRLRTFDTKSFDILMNVWVTRILTTNLRPDLAIILGPLISFGCLVLRDVVHCYNALADTILRQGTALEILFLLVDPSVITDIINNLEAYRLRIKQVHMQKIHSDDVLFVIRKSLEGCTEDDDTVQSQYTTQIESLFATQYMRDLLRRLIMSGPDAFIQKLVLPLLQNGISKPTELLNATCDYLLVGELGPKQVTTEVLLNTANELSLQFCQVKLASMLREETATMQNGEHARSDQLDAFDNAIKSAVHSGNTAWASVVPLLESSVAQHLRHRAEQYFLALFPSPKTLHHESLGDIQDRVGQAQNVLRIINATVCRESATTSSNLGTSNLGPDIVATCNGIWLLLSGSHSQETKDCVIKQWLPLLLSFVALRSSAFDIAKIGHESRARTILALTAIYLQLQGLDIEIDNETVNGLTERTFDLALFLVDGLPEDMRQQCIRSLRDTICSPGVSYMLSYCSNPSEWLVMVQKERISVASGGAESRSVEKEKLTPFVLRRWENLGEPTPNVGENDTSLSLTLFGARRG